MLTIRPAERKDADATFDIRTQAILNQCRTVYTQEQLKCWTDIPITEKYRNWVAKDYHVACLGGVPVATGFINFQSGELGALFVLPEYMEQGIGRRMVVYLEQLARGAGLSEINLDATLNAVEFYRRCGFGGTEQAIYHSPSGLQLACVPMHKTLGANESQP